MIHMLVSINENRFQRRSVPKIIIAILVCITFGCNDSGHLEKRNVGSTGLQFEEPKAYLGVVQESLFVDHKFNFSVTGVGAEKIVSIEKSCGCLSVGDGIIGKALESGQAYELPVRIDLREKVIFAESIFLKTESGSSILLQLSGVHESTPKPDRSVVLCKYKRDAETLPSGTFLVYRFRHKDTPNLVPQIKEFKTEYLTVSFQKHITDFDQQLRPPADRELLEWNWKLHSMPLTETTETVQVPWSNENLPTTNIEFRISEIPKVRGLVKQLFCGKLFAGETWQHTLTLYTPQDHALGLVKSVESTNDFILTKIEQKDSLTLLHVSLKAPKDAGKIDERIEVKFENSQESPESIRVFGTIFANPKSD